LNPAIGMLNPLRGSIRAGTFAVPDPVEADIGRHLLV
jgi:hypothetical protein